MNEHQADRRKAIGRLGERFAKDYLERNGYDIVEQNWRCKRGEIDLIAQIKDTLVFIEVRTRKSENSFGSPAESVTYRKQRRIIQLSQYYLFKHPTDGQFRFDVIAITLTPDCALRSLNHICNAF